MTGSIRSRIRSPIPWHVFARAYACRKPARPSSDAGQGSVRTASTNSSPILGDVKPLGMQAAFGERGRHDRPARAHRVHDLGRVADPVERMVHPVGDKRNVEGLVIAGEGFLGAPADRMHVGPRQEPRAFVPPRLVDRVANPADHDDRGVWKRRADPVQELPVDAIFERADVAEIGPRQMRQIGRRLGRPRQRLLGQKRSGRAMRERGGFAPAASGTRARSSSARSRDTQTVTSAAHTIARSSARIWSAALGQYKA